MQIRVFFLISFFYVLRKRNKNGTKTERTVSASYYFLHIYQVSFNFRLIFATSFTFHIRTITFKDPLKVLRKRNKNITKTERTVSTLYYFLHIYQISFNFRLIFATSFTFHIRTITFKDTVKASFCDIICCSRIRFE